MINKRIIFSLLYSNGYFFLSRNFRFKNCDLNWLIKNYNFNKRVNTQMNCCYCYKKTSKQEVENFFDNINKLRSKYLLQL